MQGLFTHRENGNIVQFTTLSLDTTIHFNVTKNYGKLTDIEGNTYKTIQIGNQIWMAENLRVTKFRDGTAIPYIDVLKYQLKDSISGYCNYGNDATYGRTFGHLYNQKAVFDIHNVCPAGWHLPSESEWNQLVTYLGSPTEIWGKLKEAGTNHWINNQTTESNETGFTALPGGYSMGTRFYDVGCNCRFWKSTGTIWHYSIPEFSNGPDNYSLDQNISRTSFFSIRCIKDN